MQTFTPTRHSNRRRALVSCLTIVFASLSAGASATDNRPITLIVPFAAGSSVDIMARVVAEQISNHLATSIVIHNRAGAGGGVGAASAARSAPDGTNLFFGTAGTHGINPAIYKDLSYDPVEDFEPVVGISSSANVMVVNPKLGIKSLADFVTLAKAKPGALNMGSGGNGTTPHLSGVLLNQVAGIETTHVPYKSGAVLDVIAGRLTYSFESIPSAIPLIKSGQLQPLAVTSATRDPILMDVPTIAESGYPNYEVMAWSALFAPRGTPRDAIDRVNSAANKALAEPELTRRLAELGSTAIGGSSNDLRQLVATELNRWPEVIRAANITFD